MSLYLKDEQMLTWQTPPKNKKQKKKQKPKNPEESIPGTGNRTDAMVLWFVEQSGWEPDKMWLSVGHDEGESLGRLFKKKELSGKIKADVN